MVDSETYKIKKNFITKDEANQIVQWIDSVNHTGDDSNYHLSELSKTLKGKSCIFDISNTPLTNYIAKFQSISDVSNDPLPDFIHVIIDRISNELNLPKNESVLIKSTYKDNPFLPDSIKRQIEDLKRTDEALYQIYALGEKAISKSNIYSNWTFLPHRPSRFTQFVYGLDFGYNHPTALVRIYWHEKDIFIEPVIYESYLTTSNLIDRLADLNIEKETEIIADYARPEIIAEMNNAGYNVLNANKSVKKGIDNIKTFGVFCLENEHLKKEYQNYKWKKVRIYF